MPECVCCGKTTRMKDTEGYWRDFDFRRQWVCCNCYDSGRYAKHPDNTFDRRDLCWRHGLPMREAGGCIQCGKEGY